MSRQLSREIAAIEYRHKKDGLWYRHDFKSGSGINLNRDGSLTVRNGSGKPVWDRFRYKGEDQDFLINSRGVRSRGVRASPRRATEMAGKKKKAPARKAPTKKTNAPRAALAKSGPRKKPRKGGGRFGKNPPMSVNGFIGNAIETAMNGVTVEVGRVGVHAISELFHEHVAGKDDPDNATLDTLIELGTSLVIGFFAPRFIGRERAAFLAAGGVSGAANTLARQVFATNPKMLRLLSGYPRGMDTRIIMNADDRAALNGYGPPARQIKESLNGYGPPAQDISRGQIARRRAALGA